MRRLKCTSARGPGWCLGARSGLLTLLRAACEPLPQGPQLCCKAPSRSDKWLSDRWCARVAACVCCGCCLLLEQRPSRLADSCESRPHTRSSGTSDPSACALGGLARAIDAAHPCIAASNCAGCAYRQDCLHRHHKFQGNKISLVMNATCRFCPRCRICTGGVAGAPYSADSSGGAGSQKR